MGADSPGRRWNSSSVSQPMLRPKDSRSKQGRGYDTGISAHCIPDAPVRLDHEIPLTTCLRVLVARHPDRGSTLGRAHSCRRCCGVARSRLSCKISTLNPAANASRQRYAAAQAKAYSPSAAAFFPWESVCYRESWSMRHTSKIGRATAPRGGETQADPLRQSTCPTAPRHITTSSDRAADAASIWPLGRCRIRPYRRRRR